MSTSLPSLVVLISGSGSNLQAIIRAVENGQIRAMICAVISNRADAGGLQYARLAGIDTFAIEHQQYETREQFDQALIQRIDHCQPELVILAGFMRILTDRFIHHYSGRLLNIHPSLLPKYKGLHTHRRVLLAGDKTHGASVHVVSTELDSGNLIIQAQVPVKTDDTEEKLAARVLKQEHLIYPLTISLIIAGTLKIKNNTLLYKGQPLKRALIWQSNQLCEPEGS